MTMYAQASAKLIRRVLSMPTVTAGLKCAPHTPPSAAIRSISAKACTSPTTAKSGPPMPNGGAR